MASSAKFTFLFLLTFLFFQIHARESNFFSKIPNNNGETTQIPNKLDTLTNSEKTQEPNFIPQTQETGYGLYGHESGQFPPSEEKYEDNNQYRGNDAVSFQTESEEYYNNNDVNNFNDDDNNNNNNDNFQNSNTKKPYENSFYYNKDLYENRRQRFPNTRLSRNDYTTTSYDNYNSNGRDNANNVVRQGMSDTRFMGNGKYYYDLEKEPQHYRSSRGNFVNKNNNNDNNNNVNSYEYGRYQNNDAEFQDQTDQFLP